MDEFENKNTLILKVVEQMHNTEEWIGLLTNQDKVTDYSGIILQLFKPCDAMVLLLLSTHAKEYNYFISPNGLIQNSNNRSFSPLSFASHSNLHKIFPAECLRLMNEIRKLRNLAIHSTEKIDKNVFDNYTVAFKGFTAWIIDKISTENSIEMSHILNLIDIRKKIINELSQERPSSELDTNALLQIIASHLNNVDNNLQKLKHGQTKIEGKLDQLSKSIHELSIKMSSCQNLLTNQLEIFENNDDKEKLLATYSDMYTKSIIDNIDLKYSVKSYEIESQKLRISLGENAWDKLKKQSQEFLISSKIIYNNMLPLNDIVDYSGICLLVTKALEVETNDRFCQKFMEYIKKKYPGKENYNQYPTSLINKYGKPIRTKDFTLGSIAYVLCYSIPKDATAAQIKNNHDKLMEYCHAVLFKNKSGSEIDNILHKYAAEIEHIKNDYRNPSAHTNQLKQINAKECFDLVLDVEKFLKVMLESFAV